MKSSMGFLILFFLFSCYHSGAEDAAKIKIQPKRSASVFSVAVSPRGRYIASGGAEARVRLWDTTTGKQIKSFTTAASYNHAVAFSRDGARIISGGVDGIIRIRDFQSNRHLDNLEGHKGKVYSIAVSPDGKLVVSAGEDKTIRIWDILQAKEINVLQKHEGEVNSIAISPDGKIIISGSDDGTFRWWKLPEGNEINRWKEHKDWVRSVAFSPKGLFFASGGYDRTIRVWKSKSKKTFPPLTGHTGRVYTIDFCLNGKTIVSGGDDRTVRLWKLDSGKRFKEEKKWEEHQGVVFAVASSPDGQTIFSGSGDGTIKIRDTNSGDLKATLVPFKDGEWAAYTPDHYYVCSPGGERYIDFYAAGSRRLSSEYAARLRKQDGLPQLHKEKIAPDSLAEPDDPGTPKGKSLSEIVKSLLNSSRSWAVVIGINSYSREKNGFNYLPYAVNDAEAVYKFLTTNMGFSKKRVFALYNHNATKKNIENLLFDTLRTKVSPDDRVLVYFSGHGERRKEKSGKISGYLIPVDGNRRALYSTCISMSRIEDFSDFIAARQVLLIIDSCFSGIAGTVFRKGSLSPETKKEIETFVKSQGRQIMTAGASHQTTFMSDKWNNHSVYTYYLLRGLKGQADLNHDGVISTRELQLYLTDNVGRDTGSKQTPQLFTLSYSEGQFIFYREGDY